MFMIFKRQAIAQRVLLVFFCVALNALEKECTEPVLVFSNRIFTKSPLPKQFRTMQEEVQQTGEKVSLRGLKRMKASGSSQITPDNLFNIIDVLRVQGAHQITVVDLRHESHTWIDGLPSYWLTSASELLNFKDVSCYNKGKTALEIEKDERERIAPLMKSCQATLYDFSKGHYPYVPTAMSKSIGFECAVLNEKDLVKLAGLEYLRLPIPDDTAPTWHIIDQLVSYYRSHSDNWFHVHCNEGRGRTTTILSMIDMLHNAKEVDFNSIIKRQQLIGVGGVDLFDFDNSGSRECNRIVAPQHDEFVYRLALLKSFYRYCKENKDNFATPFSVWAAQEGLTEEHI